MLKYLLLLFAGSGAGDDDSPWSEVGGGASKTWTAIGSSTTNRNTSFFVLLSPVRYRTDLVNLQPALRGTDADGRGGGFYITEADPIALLGSGESTI